MKIKFMCGKCGIGQDVVQPVDVADNRVFKIVCQNQHEMYWLWDTERFELLFDMGSVAFIDGYYRDAMFNFYGALESFYPFFSRYLAVLLDVDLDLFEQQWKLVAKQVERQMGVCYALYMNHFRRPLEYGFKLEDLAGVRNQIIHAGYIPSRAECEVWADRIFSFITKCAHDVYRDDGGIAMSKVATHQRAMDLKKAGLPLDTPLNGMSITKVMRFALMFQYPVSVPKGQNTAFQQRIEEFKNGGYRQHLADRLSRVD